LSLPRNLQEQKGAQKKYNLHCFTGEEEGLLGSKHFTDEPGIDLSKVNAMINMDMVED